MQSNDLIEQIRKRAYEIWETSGRPEGRHLEHWLQAELEWRSTAARPAAKEAQEAPRVRKPKAKATPAKKPAKH